MKEAVLLERVLFLLALRQRTRLPLRAALPASDDLAIRAAKYHPLVGACVGLIGAVVIWLAGQGLPAGPSVVLAGAATVAVTGGLDEAGLARAVDGLRQGRDRAAALSLMRHGPLGLPGGLALGLLLALKLSLLAALPVGTAMVTLIAAHVLGRMGAVHVMATTRNARSDRVHQAQSAVTPEGYRLALATTTLALLPVVVCCGWTAMICAVLVSILLGQGFRRLCVQKLQGYTDETLGGAALFCEVGALLGLSLWL